MRLEMSGGEFEVSGDVEIEVPYYMNALDCVEIGHLFDNKIKGYIIAIGRNPDTDITEFLTSDFLTYHLNDDSLSKHDAYAIFCGEKIAFCKEQGPRSEVKIMSSSEVIANSVHV